MTDSLNVFKTRNGLIQINHKPTRFRAGQNPSLLDSFISNNTDKVYCFETLVIHLADYRLVKLQYHHKGITNNPQFRKIRD